MKYLLCVPYGGYNDQISVIYKCLVYCKNNNRVLLLYTNCNDNVDLIDDRILNSMYNFDFNKYIHFELDNFISDKETIEKILEEELEDNDIIPCITYYSFNIPKKLQKYVKNKGHNNQKLELYGNNILLFNFPHKLITFCGCGGNYNLDINYLNKFFFKEPIKSLYNERRSLLPEFYASFHIRNTDYKCDYKKIFEDNNDLLKYPIYLATDSYEVIEYLNNISKNNVYHFTELKKDNKPIHYNHENKDKRFIEIILDLLCVANSNIFVSTPRRPGVAGGGFSTLCNTYFNNKNLIQFY
jgi:hypothetical protein